MIPLNKATLAFPFGAVDQAKGTRHLLAGELTELTNLRMLKEDEWRKRPAFDRTVGGGGFGSGTPQEYAVVAGSDMWRDSGNSNVWSRDSDSNVPYLRGTSKRAFPTHFAVAKPSSSVPSVPSSARKPLIVLAGGDIWVFSQAVAATSPFVDYHTHSWEVLDATTLVRKGGGSGATVALAGISSWSASYDSVNGKIWLLLVGSGTGIECRAFSVASPSSFPTVTAYRTVAGMAFNTVDIRKFSNGEFLVSASSFVAGTPHTCYFEHSYLNTATGVAKTSPAAVGTTSSPSGSGPRCCTGIRTLNYDGASGTAYYALWRTISATNVELVLLEINTTSLAIAATVQLVSQAVSQLVAPVVGVCSGYRTSAGERTVYGQLDVNDSTVRPRDLDITRYRYSGASVSADVVARAAILLSDPFNQGTSDEYYFVTGYDDGQTAKAQRTYFLRDQGGYLVSQFLPGEAAAAWHNAAGRDTGSNLHLHNTGFVNLAVSPASGKWMVAVGMEDVARESSAAAVVQLDFAETYAPPTVVGDVAIWNGPIPQVAGPRDQLHDLAPLLFPSSAPTFALGGGSALGTFQVAYRYRFQDSDGDLYRSAPSTSAAAAFLALGTRQVTMQALNHIGAGTAFLELYGSVGGGTDMYLQTVVQIYQGSSVAQVEVFPERWAASGELLDTIGGALSPAPPPSCRCSALWRNRVHLSGCPYPREIWSSKEMQPGRGPEFNEALVTEWSDGTGAPELLQPCDWNYLSVHKSDAVGLMSGPGPDGRGAGGYVVQTLSGQKAGRVGSAVTGPLGCYFQNVQDGRICLLPPGAPAVDIGRGVESHRATNVVAALHVESERQIWFLLADAKILVLHYAWPTASSPYGRWSVYGGAGMVSAAVGAGILGTTARYLESNATVVFRRQSASWQDDNGTYADVLTKLKFDRLRPAGHQGEFMLDVLQFEGQHIGASSLRITITNDAGQTETFPKATTASPLDYRVTAGAQTLRTKEVGVTIEETASATEGFVYDSLALEVKTTGKIKTPNVANWIAPG